MTLSDLEWLSKIFNDTKLRAVSATAELLVQCGSRSSKGMPSGTGGFLRLLIGKLWRPPNLLKFSPTQNATYTARQIWTKDVSKRAILRTDVLSHQISSPVPPKLPPKSPQNPIWGTFQCKTYHRDNFSKSHVNGSTKLKLYSYTGIGNYLGCVKIFRKGWREAQGPLM